MIFDGRTTEDFKLLTGTWVDAAAIRLSAHAALAGLIADVVVTGADRNEIGLLLICAAGHDPDDASIGQGSMRRSPTSSRKRPAPQRVTRAIVMRQPPSFDSGEITEKGSLNARLIRERRADLVTALYSGSHPDVLLAV